MKVACLLAVVAVAAAVAVSAATPRIIDISHPYVLGTPTYGTPSGLQPFTHNMSSIRDDMDEGLDVDSLDLGTLNGPCLVVDTPRGENITAEVMKGLNIPRGVERVLLKTLNTDKKLMNQSKFDWSYTAMTTDGVQYLVSNTNIKLIGIDYLSIGIADQVVLVHLTLLNAKVIIPVEGLNLGGVTPEAYSVHCLPLRLVGLDGSPARCILETSAGSSSTTTHTGTHVDAPGHFNQKYLCKIEIFGE